MPEIKIPWFTISFKVGNTFQFPLEVKHGGVWKQDSRLWGWMGWYVWIWMHQTVTDSNRANNHWIVWGIFFTKRQMSTHNGLWGKWLTWMLFKCCYSVILNVILFFFLTYSWKEILPMTEMNSAALENKVRDLDLSGADFVTITAHGIFLLSNLTNRKVLGKERKREGVQAMLTRLGLQTPSG